MADDLVFEEPTLDPEAMRKHFSMRIEIVQKLMEEGKLNSELGNMAIGHFEAHLEELGSFEM